jgi:hypothetical protein
MLYSVPVLFERLSNAYLENLITLIRAYSLSLQKKFNPEALDMVQKLFEDFVKGFETLYVLLLGSPDGEPGNRTRLV